MFISDTSLIFGINYPTPLLAALTFFESYGWFILFGFILVMVLWSNFEKSINRFFQRRKRQFDVTDTMSMCAAFINCVGCFLMITLFLAYVA